MAIATAADLASLLDLTFDVDDNTRATLLIELVQSEAQGNCHYGFEQTTDTVELPGTWDSELLLPQGPVDSVSAVTIDGDDVTDYKLVGDLLVRRRDTEEVTYGWWAGPHVVVAVTYTHGYTSTHRRAQTARAVVLRAAARAWANPEQREAITLASGDQSRFGRAGDRAGTWLTDGDLRMLTRAGLRKTSV